VTAWPTPPSPPANRLNSQAARLAQALEQRRGVVERGQALASRVHRLQGFLDLVGTGVATFDIAFPVRFLEMPAMTSGFSLADGEVVDVFSMPSVSIGVASWKLLRPIATVTYWVGATLAITVTGRNAQKLTAHWQAEGKCLRGPTTDSTGSVDGEL